jgi:predicted RNase H-like nuclease
VAKRPSKFTLVGLDVGFSARRHSSGIARIAGDGLSVGCATSSLESRKKFLGEDVICVAAIDAPILPGEDYDPRPCERLFTLGCFQRRCKPGLSHVPGTGRAFRAAGYETARQISAMISCRKLSANFPRVWGSLNLVEAFPNAFMGVLLSDRCFDGMPKMRRGKKFEWLYDQCREQKFFEALIDKIANEKLSSILHHIKSNKNHDQKAALICLLTAASVSSGRYTAVGDSKGGYFFLPHWNVWAPWARRELEIQRPRTQSVEVWIDGKCFAALAPLPQGTR